MGATIAIIDPSDAGPTFGQLEVSDKLEPTKFSKRKKFIETSRV